MPDKERAVKELLDAEAADLRDHFHELLAAAERITDYDPDAGAAAAEAEEDEYGVALDLDDDDDDAGPGAQLTSECQSCDSVRLRADWLCWLYDIGLAVGAQLWCFLSAVSGSAAMWQARWLHHVVLHMCTTHEPRAAQARTPASTP